VKLKTLLAPIEQWDSFRNSLSDCSEGWTQCL